MNKTAIVTILATIAIQGLSANQFNLPIPIGTIEEAYIIQKNNTDLTIRPGYGECSGFYWEVANDTDISPTIPSGADWVYIYIDHSASNYPVPTFTSTTTEPSWDSLKNGWYNADDRCIGSFYTDATGSNILSFTNNSGEIIFRTQLLLEENNSPGDSWVATTTDADSLTPVMADQILIHIIGSDDQGTTARVNVRPVTLGGESYDFVGGSFKGYFFLRGQRLTTGKDRSIQYQSLSSNEKAVIYLYGYRQNR